MTSRIRDYGEADHDAVVELSLRAWAPVFASIEAVLGAELSTRLHGEDWREYQARSVSETLVDPSNHSWVAELHGRSNGFVVAAIADRPRLMGEIVMLAVDPEGQHRALGRALTDHATDWLRDAGMRVALIGTGGDPGHAPARRVYEQAGYRRLPAAKYFKCCEPPLVAVACDRSSMRISPARLRLWLPAGERAGRAARAGRPAPAT